MRAGEEKGNGSQPLPAWGQEHRSTSHSKVLHVGHFICSSGIFKQEKKKASPYVRNKKKIFFKKPENSLKAHYQEIVSTVFMTVLNVL